MDSNQPATRIKPARVLKVHFFVLFSILVLRTRRMSDSHLVLCLFSLLFLINSRFEVVISDLCNEGVT